MQCHLCGAWLKSLPGRHLMGVHGWTAARYREAFGLAPRNGLGRPATRQRRAELLRRRIASDPQLRISMAAQQERARTGELTELSARKRRGRRRPLESVRVSAARHPPLDYRQVAASRRANRDARDAARFGFDSFDEYVRDRRRAGWSPAEIAAECGRHVQTLRNRVARLEGEPRNLQLRSRAQLQAAARRLGFADLASYLRERHDQGASPRAMAADLAVGSAPQTLRSELARHGLPYDPAQAGYRLNPWITDAELGSVGVRLIALDRPGVGRSTSRPRRRLLDWPDDVRSLADALGIERFAVVGFSNGGPHAAACAYELGSRVSGTALVAPMPPLDEPGALKQIGVPGWYYPLARRAPWALRALYASLVALARRNARRVEIRLVSDMSEPDRRLFAQPEFAGRFGADLAGAGSGGVVDDERLMPLPWGFEPAQVESRVHLWLGERDELVPARVWLDRASPFPVCTTTVVRGGGHFLIAEHMAEIVRDV